MKNKKGKERIKSVIDVSNVIIFFIMIALVIQIAILVFDYIEDRVEAGTISIIMLLIIFSLAMIATGLDYIRRRITIDKPVNKILDATDRIASGDFSTELQISSRYGKYSKYELICENINKMTEALRKKEMLNGDFISGVSHEIKTPLSVIKNYTKALENKDLDDETRQKYSQTIANATERLSTLIDNVLKLTKMENSEIILENEELNLTDVVAECVIAFEEKIEDKKITLSCDFADVTAVCDRGIVELIVRNLLSNAIKFTPSGGEIGVSLKTDGAFALISVKDTGVGISREEGKRIFDKFYQADPSRKQEGNGLGLSLVKKAISVAGGKIFIESQVGKGSTFSVAIGEVVEEKADN